MSKRVTPFLICLLLAIAAIAQNPEKPKLITGPVMGAITKNSAKVWIAYRGDGLHMVTLTDTVTKIVYNPSNFQKTNDSKGNVALVMDFTGLEPDHVYKPSFAFNQMVPRPRSFVRTLSDTSVKDMEFLFGSCALLNTDWSRFMFPGFSDRIFNVMKKERSDFMVWLGDNVYYFSKHYNSYNGMFNRNLKVRNQFLTLTDFLAKQPNYAMWDDHDYGWKDADKKFDFNVSSVLFFILFWT
jgi:alkaline phosphatase D